MFTSDFCVRSAGCVHACSEDQSDYTHQKLASTRTGMMCIPLVWEVVTR